MWARSPFTRWWFSALLDGFDVSSSLIFAVGFFLLFLFFVPLAPSEWVSRFSYLILVLVFWYPSFFRQDMRVVERVRTCRGAGPPWKIWPRTCGGCAATQGLLLCLCLFSFFSLPFLLLLFFAAAFLLSYKLFSWSLSCILQIGVAGVAERHLEQLILHAISDAVLVEMHPRAAINITIQIVHDDGAVWVDEHVGRFE